MLLCFQAKAHLRCAHTFQKKKILLWRKKKGEAQKKMSGLHRSSIQLGNRRVLEFIAETAAEDALLTDAIFGEYAPGGSADLDAAEGELEVGKDG